MKVAVVVFFGLCLALVMAEQCHHTSDCDHEVCVGDDWEVSCRGGTCTCEHDIHTGAACLDVSDCTGDCPGNLEQHCVDGTCSCIRG